MRKLALLIGMSEYEPDLPPIPSAQRDAQAFKQVLEHPDIGEFTAVKHLINPDTQEMQVAIETAFSTCNKDDLVLLYFSGHGIKDENGRLYLAARKTRKSTQGELIRSTAVAASFVQESMNKSRSKRQIIILDCCFSGAFAEGLLAKDDGTVDVEGQLGGEVVSREGRAVLTSSTSTQYSFENRGEDLSIYTRFLIEGISTGAADLDGDSMISVDELHDYARRKVQEAAPAMKPEIYAIREGYRILLAKAPIGDAKLRYRKEVEACATRGEISATGRRMLNYLREALALDLEEANAIESEVLKPFQEYKQNLKRYEQAYFEAAQQEYPFNDLTLRELGQYQKILRLRDEDVASIKARVAQELPKASTASSLTRSNHSFSGVASLKKQWQTVPRSAIFALVLLVAIGGSLAYFYRPDHQSPPSQSTPAEPQETSGLQLRNSMQEVQNVPAGLFNYGGAHTFAALTSAGINEAISQAHPEFRLRYTEPFDAEPGSGTGINMLINGELSFAQSARPLEENDHNKAKALGFALEQLPVAIDGVAFYTHPDLEIPGLSIDQLQAIFRGQVTNWKQVGGPDLAISPVALDPKTTSVLKLLLGGEGDDLSPKVQIVRDYTTAIRKIIATPGGISYGSAPLVATQESIRPIALAKANTKEYMSPLTEDRQINAQAFLDGTYPMTRRLFIIIRRDGSVDEKAGISYTSFLLSKEGQEIIKKAGFVPLR